MQPQPQEETYILIEESRLLPLNTKVVEGVILLPVKQKNGEQWEATLMLEIERGDFPFEYDEKVKELCVFVAQQLSLVLQQYINRNQRIKLGNYMSNLLSQGQMLFAILNREGYVLDASNSFKVLQKGFSHKGKYQNRMHISELTFYKEDWKSALSQALRGGSSRQDIFFTLNYHGKAHRKYQLTFTPIRHNDIDSAESQEVILFAHDITSQDKAQQEMQRTLEQRQQILSHMSHEIRTPLNGVIGMLDVLGNTPLQEQQQGYLNDIRNSADVLMELVNDILDYSKIEAGKLPIRLSPTDFHGLCLQTQKLFAAKAEAAKTKLIVDYDESLPHFFELDYIRVSQVLANLTSNAVKFTENGNITIRIRPCPHFRYARPLGSEERCLYIEVEDTGIGIPQNKRSELFQVFSQIHHSYNNVKGGTGLGLAISKSLVQLMGGQIGLEETRTKGATFWFTLPLKEVSSGKAVEQKRLNTKDALAQKLTGLRVLLVDDNATNRQVAKILLTQLEAEVTLAQSGTEAISYLEQKGSEYFDVILMDIQMPGLDGIETTKLIRKQYSAPPKIFALTAFALPEERDNILNEGLDGHIGKPITTETLQKALSPLCRQALPSQEDKLISKTKDTSSMLGKGFAQLLRYMSPEEAKELLDEAKVEAHQLLGVFKQEKFSYEEGMYAAHTLKGALAQIGGDVPAASAKLLEQYFRRNEGATEIPKELWDSLLEETQQFFDAVKDALAT
jgi:signal transduction histidine kinase/CheY-like chemotaxis protein